MGIHKSLTSEIKEIKVESEDIQVVSLYINKESKKEDMTIINVYDSQEHSSYKKNIAPNINSTLDDLLDIFENHIDTTNCVLLGDFNARTGDRNHIISEEPSDENDCAPTSYPVSSTRNSRDTVLNKRGKELLDLL